MSKYNIKCTSCGIDISFDDIPPHCDGGEIECGVCGTFVEFTIPQEKPSTPAINMLPVQDAQTTSASSADYSLENDKEKSKKDLIDSSLQKTLATPQPPPHFREESLTVPAQLKNAPAVQKVFPWIPILASALSLVLIVMVLMLIGLKDKKSVKADTPEATPSVGKKDTQPAMMPTTNTPQTQSLSKESLKKTDDETSDKEAATKKAEYEKRKAEETKLADMERTKIAAEEKLKLEEEKKIAFSTEIDEEKIKRILLAESGITAEAIEKGKNKSVNEINEEVKIEQNKLIDLKFPESMLDQIRKDAHSKFNKDDMPSADAKFPRDMLSEITDEAKGKFKLIKIGDTVTMPKRQSAGYINITGTYYGIDGDKIKVKESKILIADLPADTRDMLTEDGVNKRISDYITGKYQIPKENYDKQRRIELEKAKQNIGEYIQANYFNPKLEYTKTSRQEIGALLFKQNGFVFNSTKNTREYFGEYIKSKYSEFRSLKKEISSLTQNSNEMQKSHERTNRLYNASTQSLDSLKSISKKVPRIIGLSAFIIAMEKEDLYEIAITEYNSYSGTRALTDRHAVLVTEETTFSTKGHFTMDVIVLDSIPVKLKGEFGGFNQKWTVYKEATYKDKKIFLELTEKENAVALLRTKLDDSIQQRQLTDKRIQEIKNYLAKYEAL